MKKIRIWDWWQVSRIKKISYSLKFIASLFSQISWLYVQLPSVAKIDFGFDLKSGDVFSPMNH